MSSNGSCDRIKNGYHDKEVFIVSATRTPIGSWGGCLSSLTAPQLASLAIKSALEKAGNVPPESVEKVIIGQAVQAGCGQSAAKQALVGAGLPYTCRDALINEVCASGTQALIMGTNQIKYLNNDCIVAAGMESMSSIPFYQRRPPQLPLYGGIKLDDGLEVDGLTDTFNKCHMGQCAEHTAKKYNITRQDQDEYAISSYQRAKEAYERGILIKEITPVEVSGGRNKPAKVISEDEEYKKIDLNKVATLRPAFTDASGTGTITAANASTLSDGAAACLLMSSKAISSNNVTPLAKIISYGESANDPIDFATAPADAMKEALERANLKIEDIAAWEINEAFSVAALANIKILGLDREKVNINGGGVSLGHPLGMSGVRIVVTLVHNLQPGQYGCASICRGGGGASAIIIQRV